MATTKEIRKKLNDLFGCDDETGYVTYSKGVWTVREGYYYRHGKSEQHLADLVLKYFPEAKIQDMGDHWAMFNGGASIRRSSHWWVKFTL